ncbi:hypothetical protein RT717_26640 [Imperialibacter roseus]|uniref:Transposase n=1 Tax=Imperialibacter roseus TaxID=1324217 RepID=A0ABZ0IQ13_9BACT|nr:hypothetical protein [Imperialibacter roseus]WOK06656.1 hypothetical protein RT717_26640 [Imperialibacter roseus]
MKLITMFGYKKITKKQSGYQETEVSISLSGLIRIPRKKRPFWESLISSGGI